MFVRFNVNVECESLVKNCEGRDEVCDLLATDSQVDNSQKVTGEAHDGI